MNLLKRKIDYDTTNILDFRQYQYDIIPDFLYICFKYLENNGFHFKWEDISFSSINDMTYESQNQYAIKTFIVNMNNKKFLTINMPRLINGTFFKLNGSLYIPTIRIIDYPITIKKNSIMISSLFTPITIYHKDSRVIILRNNVNISQFLRLFYSKDEVEHICLNIFSSKYSVENLDTVIRLFSKFLNCNNDHKTVLDKLDKLFFDEWTAELYKQCYNLQDPITLKDVLDICIKNEEKSIIDLNYKRLVFLEHLMYPLVSRITKFVKLIMTGKTYLKFPLDCVSIIDYFFSSEGLQSNFFYDIDNGYNGLLSLKASFKSPGGDKAMPADIRTIHPTFRNKICPITVSNKNTGEVVSLIPNQIVDLKYGLFKKDAFNVDENQINSL